MEHLAQLVVGRLAPPDPEVLGDGRLEEVGVLVHQAHHGAQLVAVEAVECGPVQCHLAGFGGQETKQHGGQGGLARPARSHHRHPAPG